MSRRGIQWYKIWKEDKESIILTMLKNIWSDLDAGYKFYGESITKQISEVKVYQIEYDQRVRLLDSMPLSDANKWCYKDLKKRGAIN